MNSIGDNIVMASDTIYVVVAKDSKLNVVWAIQNSGGKRICILHVHVPSPKIPMMGAKFPASALTKQQVEAYRKTESQDMHKALDAYLLISQRMGLSNHHRVRSISSYAGSGTVSSISSPETSWCPSPLSIETTLIPSDGSESVLDLKTSCLSSIKEEYLHHSSPPSVLDGGLDSVYEQLENFLYVPISHNFSSKNSAQV